MPKDKINIIAYISEAKSRLLCLLSFKYFYARQLISRYIFSKVLNVKVILSAFKNVATVENIQIYTVL